MATTAFQPTTPDYAERVRDSFRRQRVMQLLGAELVRVEPGLVEIVLPFRPDLTQQHGFLHAGVVTTVVDSACGYAAFTLMPAGAEVLTVEYKVNFMAPARGRSFLARGRVLRSGRHITVCTGEVLADTGDTRLPVATMLATMFQVMNRPDVKPA